MQYAVTGREMKEYDEKTISRIGIPALVLMERQRWKRLERCLRRRRFFGQSLSWPGQEIMEAMGWQ